MIDETLKSSNLRCLSRLLNPLPVVKGKNITNFLMVVFFSKNKIKEWTTKFCIE